jgi:hypothetical protein
MLSVNNYLGHKTVNFHINLRMAWFREGCNSSEHGRELQIQLNAIVSHIAVLYGKQP